MIERIKQHINRIRWEKLSWKKMGSYNVGLNFIVLNPDCIEIGNNFSAEFNFRIQAWKKYGTQTFSPNIKIGDNVSFMENCQISCCNGITIGDGCLFGANVFVTDNFHGNTNPIPFEILPIKRLLVSRGKVSIGRNVWIGRNVCVMPGVTIGDGAIVGSNAVVTRDIPQYSIAVGVPAKIIQHV